MNQATAQETTPEDECGRLTREVVATLDSWQVGDEIVLLLLGYDRSIRMRELTRLRHGTAVLKGDEVMQRVRHLLGIQRALQVTFPFNPNMPGFWVTTHDRHLKGMPLEIMVNDGLSGMERVWKRLDCTRNWEDD
ncbi:MAG: hypothetical protein HQL49_02460 [Gammaproteobacteria bacterium]|nr:hypothetical protein [Gammaproteobacteria bacterium]